MPEKSKLNNWRVKRVKPSKAVNNRFSKIFYNLTNFKIVNHKSSMKTMYQIYQSPIQVKLQPLTKNWILLLSENPFNLTNKHFKVIKFKKPHLSRRETVFRLIIWQHQFQWELYMKIFLNKKKHLSLLKKELLKRNKKRNNSKISDLLSN